MKRIRTQLQDYTDELLPVSHVPGSINPADLNTRGLVKLSDLGLNSLWQHSPSFPTAPYSKWPRMTADKTSSDTTPAKELRAVHHTSTVTSVPSPQGLAEVMGSAVNKASTLGLGLASLVNESLSREKLELSVRSLACVLGAVLRNDRDGCLVPPSPRLV